PPVASLLPRFASGLPSCSPAAQLRRPRRSIPFGRHPSPVFVSASPRLQAPVRSSLAVVLSRYPASSSQPCRSPTGPRASPRRTPVQAPAAAALAWTPGSACAGSSRSQVRGWRPAGPSQPRKGRRAVGGSGTPIPSTDDPTAPMAEPPPWADGLPHAALREIVRRVPCAVDRGSMAGACRSWRARLADLPPPPPPLPWLVLPSGGSTRFYCALSGCVHHYETNAPPHGARFFGSHEGAWLFLAFNQNTDHELVNLRADRTFLIPDKYRLQQDGPLAAAHDDMVILAAALSSPPDQGKCVGACIISRWPANVPTLRRFAFWHVEFGGDADAYDLMPDPDPTPPHLQVEDVLCYQGAFYFLTQGEHIRRCEPVHDAGGDLEVLSDVWFFQREGRNYDGLVVQARYLVVSRDELLMVVRLTCGANKPAAAFRVFRALRPVQDVEEVADEDGEDNQVAEADDQGEEIEYPWSWGELDTLGGQMLFVGRGCSRSYKTAEYPGFEDGIYFLDDRSFYDDHCVCERQYPCSNNGRWTQGPPPNIELYFPEQGPSDHSPPAWLLLYNRPYAKALPLDMVREISRHIICDTERVRTLRVCCLVLSDPGARAIQPQLPWLLAASTDGPLLYCLNCGSGGNGTTHTTGAP
uniref:KIB1-4 beta-propeller domain-containing protein n=1 Tax=Setaria italica TaxID=4555 RepID=K3ZFJ5_SETIT